MWPSVRPRNAATRSSSRSQIRDTSDLKILVSMPMAGTRSSTDRVDTPLTYASMITAYRAWSMRRRGSSSSGKNDPLRSFGIANARSPALVDNTFGRDPLRSVTRPSVRS